MQTPRGASAAPCRGGRPGNLDSTGAYATFYLVDHSTGQVYRSAQPQALPPSISPGQTLADEQQNTLEFPDQLIHQVNRPGSGYYQDEDTNTLAVSSVGANGTCTATWQNYH